jgi:hypothetical protein
MANPTISSSSKHQWISEQDFDIMMICMDYHETFLPLHLMIPTTSTLFHPVSLVAPSSSSHFTSWLPHQPHVIPQSYILTPRAYPSHKQSPCVPCLGCVHLYIVGTGLTRHQTSCITHNQSSFQGCQCL